MTARDNLDAMKCEAEGRLVAHHAGGTYPATADRPGRCVECFTIVPCDVEMEAREKLRLIAFYDAVMERAGQWATVRDTARAATFRRVSATLNALAEQHLGGHDD